MGGLIARIYGEPHPDERERNRSIDWFLKTYTIVLIFISVSALVIAASNGRNSWAPNFATFLGLSLLTSATSFAGGGFIGFLFGVPRMKSLEADNGAGVSSNTNLEQVSDWLTKIIVGVSLVEFDKVGQALWGFRTTIDQAIGGDAGRSGINGAGFAMALILIGSAIAGFLAAYLKSKTDLMEAFAPRQEVESKLGAMIADEIMAEAGRKILDRPTLEPDKCAREMAAKLIQLVPPETRDVSLHRLMGLAQSTLKNFRAAADAFHHALKLAADQRSLPPADLHVLASRAATLAGDMEAANDFASRGADGDESSSDQNERELAALFSLLYTPGSCDEAIRKGEALAERPRMARSGRLWLYLAAAHGQHHATLKSMDPNNLEALLGARDEALQAARKAIQLDRTANGLVLTSLWDPKYPGKHPDENDLESLYPDEAFATLFAPWWQGAAPQVAALPNA